MHFFSLAPCRVNEAYAKHATRLAAAPWVPGCLVCLGPMTSYACRMPQRLGCMPQNSLCHKNRAQCFGIVHFSSTTAERMELVGRGRGTTQSNNDDKRLSERLIQLRSHSTPSLSPLPPLCYYLHFAPSPFTLLSVWFVF